MSNLDVDIEYLKYAEPKTEEECTLLDEMEFRVDAAIMREIRRADIHKDNR